MDTTDIITKIENINIQKEITDFLQLAKDLNYDIEKIYEQSPIFINVSGGIILSTILLVMLMRSSLRKSKASTALKNLENPDLSFEDFQKNLAIIAEFLPKSNKKFRQQLSEVVNQHYKNQIHTLDDAQIDEKIDKLQAMAQTYKDLSIGAKKDKKLSETYKKFADGILDSKIYYEISNYIDTLYFNEQSVPYLEKIVAYANEMGADGVKIKDQLMERLQEFDFGASLEIFLFVRSLDPEKLGDIYDYCIKKQSELFEKNDAMISDEIIDYLMEHGHKEEMYQYIKNLTHSVHLKELSKKYFNQTPNENLDFAFIANKTEINHEIALEYKTYILDKITDHWKDKEYLATIIERENVANVAGHDEIRKVIERIDQINDEEEERVKIEEALEIAKNAQAIALEAKELAEGK
ncbi:hypothetical protein MNB_SM-3-1134 [hydrothermal vent metagenome]|uniref:Uncharacterized protein n=1 Tax=hydrothermal vent metagenome TaxID=652676 RepID=A0A1W1D531_9ZZZZ